MDNPTPKLAADEKMLQCWLFVSTLFPPIKKNPIKLLGDAIFGGRHPESLAMSQKDRVLTFANKHIDEMFKIYDNLASGQQPKEFSDKLFNKFSSNRWWCI